MPPTKRAIQCKEYLSKNGYKVSGSWKRKSRSRSKSRSKSPRQRSRSKSKTYWTYSEFILTPIVTNEEGRRVRVTDDLLEKVLKPITKVTKQIINYDEDIKNNIKLIKNKIHIDEKIMFFQVKFTDKSYGALLLSNLEHIDQFPEANFKYKGEVHYLSLKLRVIMGKTMTR